MHCPLRCYHSQHNQRQSCQTFFSGTKQEITLTVILANLWAVVNALGENVLGYKSADVGTHRHHSGCAMALHLAGIPVYMIVLIGQWSSESFLHYIHCQVCESSASVRKCMVQIHPFYTIPNNFAHALLPCPSLIQTFNGGSDIQAFMA